MGKITFLAMSIWANLGVLAIVAAFLPARCDDQPGFCTGTLEILDG
ncbi:hypothetical protein Pan181_00740 [Aeoliella mucimassa]|uniref:Uncharacterized protein n=1 Tax=Aeoliella mucimassa TaxID=2527972 RepID=A0A518AGN9_9BACT|nr:hypothetical protein Pan181_00740 [Aeoliella mucimassa]